MEMLCYLVCWVALHGSRRTIRMFTSVNTFENSGTICRIFCKRFAVVVVVVILLVSRSNNKQSKENKRKRSRRNTKHTRHRCDVIRNEIAEFLRCCRDVSFWRSEINANKKSKNIFLYIFFLIDLNYFQMN